MEGGEIALKSGYHLFSMVKFWGAKKMVKIRVPSHPMLGGCLTVYQVWMDAVCGVLSGPKSHRKKKSKSKLKDAMSQSSDEREECDVEAGKHDSAVGYQNKKTTNNKKKNRKSLQRKGTQFTGERANENIFSKDAFDWSVETFVDVRTWEGVFVITCTGLGFLPSAELSGVTGEARASAHCVTCHRREG